MMQTKKLALLCLGLSISVFSQTANNLVVEDSRSTNLAPNQYIGHSLKVEFKDRGVIGVPGAGGYSGMLTFTPWSDNSGNKHHQLNFNDGGIFYRTGLPESIQWDGWRQIITTNEIGDVGIGTNLPSNIQGWERALDVHGTSHSKLLVTTNEIKTGIFSHVAWYGGGGFIGTESNHNLFLITNYTPKLSIVSDNVGIGTTNPQNRLDVNGTAHAKGVKVDMNGWSDYVLKKDYKLPSLAEIEKHIKERGTLPDIPSEKEVIEKGISLGEMNKKLLQKIEDLTLYSIEQNKQLLKQGKTMEIQNKKILEQQQELQQQNFRIERLEKEINEK